MHPSEHIKSQKELEDLVKARYPLVYLVSSEEARVGAHRVSPSS